MSYSISTRFYQGNTNAFFIPVERTIWNYAYGGTWTEANGESVLTMGTSVTSGIVRFVSGREDFAVVLGVHNYLRWCDIVTDLPSTTTATTLNPLYYTPGTYQSSQRENQGSSCSAKSSNGRPINVTYTVATGNNLKANIGWMIGVYGGCGNWRIVRASKSWNILLWTM